MAVDDRGKRASCITLGLPWRPLPDPDTALNEFDIQQLAYCYAGIDTAGEDDAMGVGSGFMSAIERGGM